MIIILLHVLLGTVLVFYLNFLRLSMHKNDVIIFFMLKMFRPMVL